MHAAAPAAGCSAGVLCGHILNRMDRGELKNILFMATGALMSTTSSQQGESHTGHRAFGACGEGIKKPGTICTELLRRMMQLSYVTALFFLLSFESNPNTISFTSGSLSNSKTMP